MDSEVTARELIGYLVEHHVGNRIELTASTSLFEGKLMDSIRLVELIEHVERRYQVRVSPTEIVLENFDTVERMTAYLRRKRKGH